MLNRNFARDQAFLYARIQEGRGKYRGRSDKHVEETRSVHTICLLSWQAATTFVLDVWPDAGH